MNLPSARRDLFCKSFVALFVFSAAFFFLGESSQAQSQGQFRAPQPSANDPAVVHPQRFTLQPTAQNQPPPPTIQPNGQRTFAQPSEVSPAVQLSETGQTSSARTAVQPASWTTESSDSVASKSKSRIPLELKARSREGSPSIDRPKGTWGATLSLFFSLAVVISFFLLVVWLIRKSQPNSFVKLPGDVVQVMGRTPMAPRQQMYVVRFGSKLLLISHQPGQTQTLGEITDLDEVQRLAGLCEAAQPGSISNSFRDVLKQVTLGKSEPDTRAAGRLLRR